MRFLFVLYIILFYSLALKAQIKGTVFDSEKNVPLVGVNIYMQQDSVGIGVTDKNGDFILTRNRIDKNDTLVFSYVGYLSFKCTLPMLEHLKNRIIMFEQPQPLDEVVVSAENQTYFLEYISLKSLPEKVYSFGSFLLDKKIYVIAGDETLIKLVMGKGKCGTEAWEYHSSKMYIYDIATDTWEKSHIKIVPRTGHAARIYKNRIFILGGKRYSANRKLEYTDATMEVYDIDKDTLYVDPVNPHQAIDFTSFIYNDLLYVMGGAVKENVFTNKIHTLDLKKGVWYEMEDIIPKERCGRMNGILVGHKVYFFGGYRTAPLWSSASYDLQTGKWDQLCGLKDGVAYPGLAAHGDYIYIYENKNLQVYNIKTDSIRIYSLTLNLEGAGLFYFDGNLYIVGGCTRSGIYVFPQNDVYSIDVSRISR